MDTLIGVAVAAWVLLVALAISLARAAGRPTPQPTPRDEDCLSPPDSPDSAQE